LTRSDANECRLAIDESEAGSRLDRVIIRHIGQGRRGLVMRLIRRGNVRVNRKRARASQRLNLGDSIYLPASLRPEGSHDSTEKRKRIPREFSADILYEDEYILILNKPAGTVVHAGSGYEAGIIEQLRETGGLAELRLAHRLDRDTSGCLLLSKSLPALRELAADFRAGRIRKTYLAWVEGYPFPHAGRLRSFLRKGVVQGGERMVVHHEEGQEAITDYQVILHGNQSGLQFSLLALMPLSGRTHQLRVQLQHEGHAILGDNKYGSREVRKLFRGMGGKSMALHAWRLRFAHPVKECDLDIQAPLPDWWKDCFAPHRQGISDTD